MHRNLGGRAIAIREFGSAAATGAGVILFPRAVRRCRGHWVERRPRQGGQSAAELGCLVQLSLESSCSTHRFSLIIADSKSAVAAAIAGIHDPRIVRHLVIDRHPAVQQSDRRVANLVQFQYEQYRWGRAREERCWDG